MKLGQRRLQKAIIASGATTAMLANVVAKAGVLVSANFNAPTYFDGPLVTYTNTSLAGQDGWYDSSGSTGKVTVSNSATNGYVTLSSAPTAIQKVRKLSTVGQVINSGSAYLQADFTLTAAGTGDYFIHLGDGGIVNYFDRVYAEASGSGFVMGLATGSGTGLPAPSYGSTVLNFGTTYTLLARYDFVSGMGNDTGALFINPTTTNGSGDIPYVNATTVGTDATQFGSIGLYQSSTAGAGPTATVDNISVYGNVTTLPNVTLLASDSTGQSSFVNGTNWSDGATPSIAATYSVAGGKTVRTVVNDTSEGFQGTSLTLGDNSGTPATILCNIKSGRSITISNLTLNNGVIENGGDNGAATSITIYGNYGIALGAGGGTFKNDLAGCIMAVPYAISGGGGVTIAGPGMVTLSGVNTYTGNTLVSGGSLLLSSTGQLKFVIGNNGTSNTITSSGGGTADFEGSFALDLSNASANMGDSWTLVGSSLLPVYGANFAIANFTNIGGGYFVSSDGEYDYSEATGQLTVVPEPTFITFFSLPILAAFTRRRRSERTLPRIM